MKHLSLAARYRPQTFAQVAGQDMVKTVLSRAAAEDVPAPAYLLSGTRGVGKTTVARIFAKALNCEHAPGPEPCNACEQCRKITQGVHVDVAEIDGASNNSVEDARALRETIGYAPMEGRYKVFIIDEAHMLSRSAFNALLKTLEEPPERVVFIFATTEAHKFPVTIVSRCQHFVFRHLGEEALASHLSGILRRENAPFEDAAVRLIAKRAAGSVRDGMSLLDQALALGGDTLTAAATREVLGLAGQELFAGIFQAVRAQDCAAVAALCRQVLDQGVDIGFFIRELAGHLRDCFLLRQAGPAIEPSLRLAADEAAFWRDTAQGFSVAHLHAAWQMALDAQRGIVQSPEPGAALEMLLLNLALLPHLLPVGLATPGGAAPPAPAAPEAAAKDATARAACPPPPAPSASPAIDGPAPALREAPPEGGAHPAGPAVASTAGAAPHPGPKSPAPMEPAASAPSPARPEPSPAAPPAATASGREDAPERRKEAQPPAPGDAPRDWKRFCDFCAARQGGMPAHILRQAEARWTARSLSLTAKSATVARELERHRQDLRTALAAYGAGDPDLDIVSPRAPRLETELIEAFSRRPELQDCLDVLKARVKGCRPVG